MSEPKNTKVLRRICYTALVFCLLLIVAYCCQAFHQYAQITPTDNVELRVFCFALFYGHFVTKLGLLLLCALFAIFQLGGLRQGDLFPRRNVGIIIAVAILAFLSSIFEANIGQIYKPFSGSSAIEIKDGAIAILLLLLVFAQVYRIGGNAARENQLTI
jgi:hypothetical protein